MATKETYHPISVQTLAHLKNVVLTRVGDLVVHMSDDCLKAINSGKAFLDLRLVDPEMTPTVILGAYSGRLKIGFKDSNAGLILERSRNINLHALFYQNSLLEIKAGASINACQATIADATISIDEDCMMSHGVILQPSDQHDIYNTLDDEIINKKRGITIGKHVWLGKECYVGAGVTIGDNAIIGAHAVVASHVAAGNLVAGNPARVLRTDITWTRKFVLKDIDLDGPETISSILSDKYLAK